MAVTHLSRIINAKTHTITTTLCGRMTDAEINCSTDAAEVTCKLCGRLIAADAKRKGAA